MKQTKKLCGKCNTPQFIWKNYDGIRLCLPCWKLWCAQNKKVSPKPTKPIPHSSPKRIIKNKEYLKLRKQALLSNPTCQVMISSECMGVSSEIHHKFCGANRDEHFLDTTSWFCLCRNCHLHIHANVKEAKELGFLK